MQFTDAGSLPDPLLLCVTLNRQGHTHAPRDTPKRGKFPNHVVGSQFQAVFCSQKQKPFSLWGRPIAPYRPPLVLPGLVSGAHIQQGPRESGTWAERWVKPKELSVGKICSGCFLVGPPVLSAWRLVGGLPQESGDRTGL